MELPTWEECQEAVRNGTATQLHLFIYEYEPELDDVEFRDGLLKVLKEAKGGD